MAKKTQFECLSCGYISAKWQGKCPQCNDWNSFEESAVEAKKTKSSVDSHAVELNLAEIDKADIKRFKTQLSELNYVLGDGIVNGSSILLGGAPGIGKSTLVLQLLKSYASKQFKSLYISGEEAPYQIKLRAERLQIHSDSIIISTEIELNNIKKSIQRLKPDIVVIDSIQTIYNQDFENSPGSLVQIKDCTFRLVKLAKELGIPIVIIGHITKEGQIAGPKVLEHMVDVVLYFEGDSLSDLRLLRAIKNRYGSANEVALFEMTEKGLVEEKDLNRFLSDTHEEIGVALSSIKEGTRHLLVEIQALVSKSNYGIPQRVSNGVDQKRLSVILAVLEKKGGIFLGDQDVFVKVSAAIKINDPSADMAIAAAIWSSFANRSFAHKSLFLGELSLAGKFQKISLTPERIKDFNKYGFKDIVCNSDVNGDAGQMLKHVKDIDALNDYIFNLQ